jgi:hypothetical protein
MSTTDPRVGRYSSATESYYRDDYSAIGWMTFAGVMLAMLATLNFIDGVAAVSNSSFFVADAKYVFSDLNTFGWILIAVSVVQIVTAFGVWGQWKGVRWVGVTIAALNSVVQLTFMPSYPFWSLCLFALDILVIYALVVHGARRSV